MSRLDEIFTRDEREREVSKPIEMCDRRWEYGSEEKKKNRGDDVLTGVLKGKPVVCIAFENMHMSVQKPVKLM